MFTTARIAEGRDNNFNLIRMVAALAVMLSHAWPIALGPGATEPLQRWLGHSLGSVAVYVFFATSGLLITASFMRVPKPSRFLLARFLRLFPGLLVSLLLVAFVLGPLVTTLPLESYGADPGVWQFLWRGLLLVSPQYTLPGVFETNPYPMVEGSIWTLIYEVLCYLAVLVAGLLGLFRRRLWVAVAVAGYAVIWLLPEVLNLTLHPKVAHFRSLSLPFLMGAVFYVWRDRLALTLWGVLVLAAVAATLRTTPLYAPALVLALTYGTFWLAYVPGGLLRRYNRLGDYSYGVYIYAFPLQGLAVWLYGAQTPLQNVVLALPMTLLAAVASWHLVEKPTLSLRFAAQRGAEARRG